MTRELLTGADFKGPLQINGSAGTSGQLLASQGDGAIPQWVAAGGFSGGTLTSNLTLASGTTSLSPLTLQSGTNLTTAAAGAFEYDGKVIYSTPAGRGVSPSKMYYRLNADLAGLNSTADQSVFGVGVTLQADTVYAFEGLWRISKTSGAGSHTVRIGWGGTLSFNNFYVEGTAWRQGVAGTSELNNNMNSFYMRNSFAHINLMSTGSVSVSQSTYATFKGTISVNAGGTFIPQFSLSSLPNGVYSTIASSYISIWPIGAAGANVSVGPWA